MLARPISTPATVREYFAASRPSPKRGQRHRQQSEAQRHSHRGPVQTGFTMGRGREWLWRMKGSGGHGVGAHPLRVA